MELWYAIFNWRPLMKQWIMASLPHKDLNFLYQVWSNALQDEKQYRLIEVKIDYTLLK